VLGHPKPIVLLANDVLGSLRLRMMLQAPPLPTFAVTMFNPDIVIPCSVVSEMATDHMQGEAIRTRLGEFMRDVPSSRKTVKASRKIAHTLWMTVIGATRFKAQERAIYLAETEKVWEDPVGVSGIETEDSKFSSPVTEQPWDEAEYFTKTQLQELINKWDLQPGTNAPEPFEAQLRDPAKFKVDLRRPRPVLWALLQVFRRYHKAFSYEGHIIGHYDRIPYEPRFIKPPPRLARPRTFSPMERALLEKERDTMLELRRWRRTNAVTYASDATVVRAPSKEVRTAFDYRGVNDCMAWDPYPFPVMMDIVNWLVAVPF